MQQQILSYAYQLSQNAICTSISSNPNDMLFYCSTQKRDNPQQSTLYRLNYLQNQPRKSQTSSINIKGTIKWLKNIKIGQDIKLILNIKTQNGNQIRYLDSNKFDKNNNQQINLNQLQLFYKTTNNNNQQINQQLCNFQKGKDSSLYIALNKQIICFDINKLNTNQSVVKLQQNKNIQHFTVDPARGYLTYTVNNQIFITDKSTKTQKYSFKLSPSLSDTITNINYNPNKQYYLMSGHHDFMKFWDVRKTNIPVKIVGDHHSLLLKSIYNLAHDQLIITSYDDGAVGLYRMPSVSSNPSGQGSDALVKIYDEHQDSVYHTCWSHTHWIFASVSHNATNMVINIVPSVQKYRILL